MDDHGPVQGSCKQSHDGMTIHDGINNSVQLMHKICINELRGAADK